MISKEEYIDGNKFESIADIGFGDKYTKELPLNINKLITFLNNFNSDRLPIVYVDGSRVRKFFTLIKDIKTPFKLLSHNCDTTFTEKEVKNRPQCVVKWFGQNINAINNEDIVSLPIGLERQHWSKILYGASAYKHNKIYQFTQKNLEKNKLCYINFNSNTNKIKRAWIVPFFKKKNWCHIRIGGKQGNFDHYLKDCLQSHYVLCPDGNGIDCHRNWEMLYIGAIPIVENSYFHQTMYENMNVLIVDNFKDLNEEFLLEKLNYFKKNKNIEKLKFSYWENIIKK
tara:strand:- start:4480 stop:5331 length:852 start_codon:yes stop_codon:yes gene_type:complete